MKRYNFILSAFALVAAPYAAFTQNNKNKMRSDKGFKIKAGEGRLHGHIKLKGVNANILDLKVSGSDTDEGFALFEQTSLTPGKGTPLHVHHKQHEVFYVVAGNYYFQVGEDKYELSTGDSIFLPMKIPHVWTQVSEQGNMVVLFQPAGKMENFFLTVASLNYEPDKEEMAKYFKDNDMEIVGPPLKLNK